MTIPIEAYTIEGVVTGLVEATGGLRDLLETLDAIRVSPCHRVAIDGTSDEVREALIATDELLLVVPDVADTVVHAAWHDLRLFIGPWCVDAHLATQPGFDPARALARPSGTFVHLNDASVALRAEPERVLAAYAELLVNRYVVDDVECLLILSFHFPGATLRPVAPALAQHRSDTGGESERDRVAAQTFVGVDRTGPGTGILPRTSGTG